MRFDDRLLTVLSQPAGDRHDAAVRWRQLVDLVARAGPVSGSPIIGQALETILAEAPAIDEDLRAAAARAVAARPLPYGLLEYFVSDRLSVSAPVLAAATLDQVQWRALLETADEETRRFVETIHPEAASLPPPAKARPERRSEPSVEQAAQPGPHTAEAPPPSLSEVVARIERRRRNREAQRYAAAAEADAVDQELPSLFRWECGPSGEIAWVEGAPRGALIGRSIAGIRDDENDRIDEEVVRAFSMRAPFRDGEMTVAGEGLVAGSWKISGLPAFDPTDGRFAGYRGVALREPERMRPRRELTADLLADPDSVRELVHEIKTPLNAIIGFAEIIDGQYLGPADHQYRERAREIVAQARILLGAIEDLDFAAKIHSAGSMQQGVDLAQLLERSRDSLTEAAKERGVELEVARSAAAAVAVLEPEIGERLLQRFATAILELTTAGEHLQISASRREAQSRIALSRPEALRELSDAQLFEDAAKGLEAGPLSPGFSLRLVRGLARVAGGDLVTTPATLALAFPGA